MSITTWLRKHSIRSSASPARRPEFRPRLTFLEDRSVPSFGWAAGVGGNYGTAIATDAAGNVYMTGSFSSSFTPAGSNVTLNSAGNNDIFVTKYTRSGAFVWAVSMGGTQNDSGNGIAVDGTGTNVYVAGQYAGGYVAQLSAATGAVNWSRTVSGTAADAVAMDGSGAAYVTSRQGDLGTRFVAKLDAAGTQQWQDTITSSVMYHTPTVAVAGNTVYVGGDYVTSATFAIGSRNYSVTTAKNAAAGYVLKLGSDNTYSWAQNFQGVKGGGVLSNRIAADSAGNVYAFGEFLGKVGFGTSTTLDAGRSNDADFVAKLTPAGTVAWAKQFGPFPGGYDMAASAIAVDGAGAVYLTGSFAGTTSFNPAGGGNLTSIAASPLAAASDIFVSKLDTNGTFQWAVRAGTGSYDSGYGIAVDSFGDVDVTGVISAGTADFDPANTWFDNRDLVTAATGGGFLWQIVQP